jgi:acetamidase/formamidase
MLMKHLKATSSTVHFGFYDAILPPVLEIESGEEIEVSSISAHPDDDVPSDWLPSEIHDIYARAPRGGGPHILTGPIALRNSQPGDVLQIDILEILLIQSYGYNTVYPLKGMFGTESPRFKSTIIPIDLKSGLAEVAPGIQLPTRPFFGQMGVAPPREWGRYDSRPPNKFGGNIDNKELVPGARLFLPIWVEGALFSVGDGHAAPGVGEVNQTAIETRLQGRLRLSIRRDLEIDLPFAATRDHLMTMAFNESLDNAARLAMRSMIRLLETHYHLAFHDAYRLCSVAADMRVTQFVNGNRGIHVLLPQAPLAGLRKRPAFLDSIEMAASAAG